MYETQYNPGYQVPLGMYPPPPQPTYPYQPQQPYWGGQPAGPYPDYEAPKYPPPTTGFKQ
jgi:hypothetical protein